MEEGGDGDEDEDEDEVEDDEVRDDEVEYIETWKRTGTGMRTRTRWKMTR